MIRTAIVTIGDEILIGQIVDTNSAWLGKELNGLGITVERILSIGDSQDDIFSTLAACVENYDLTLVTGGLGPTKDDITKQILCDLFGGELVQHQASYDSSKEILDRVNVEMNIYNEQQSLVPNVCEVILNHHGTAPGMLFRKENNILISMPGVPFEMKEMCSGYVFDILKNNFKLNSNVHQSIVTFGIAESILAERIFDWEDNLPEYLHLAYLPNSNRVRLRLSAYDVVDERSVKDEIDVQFNRLSEIIPEYYIGDEQTEVEVSLSNIIKQRGESLSIAESCTGGEIASRITKYDGASQFFLGGVVSYCNSVKISTLGVDSSDIEDFGAVSGLVVEQMAQGVRKLTGSTYSIATSGIAGNSGGTVEKPVGTVWIAIDTPQGTFSKLHTFSKLRVPNIERASSQGIYMLLQHILNLELLESK